MIKSFLLRMSPAEKAWLEYRAASENRTQSAELLRLVANAMKADPLKVFVHEVAAFGLPTTYSVSLGEYGDDLYESADKEQAIAFARAKIGELGLPRDAIVFNTVTDKAA